MAQKIADFSDRSWRSSLSRSLIVTRREVVDSFRDWRILTPILILTFLFPYLATFVADQFFDFIIRNAGGGDLTIIAERSIPFLLMVVGFFPISISLVIALETFVGEKERRSLEPLLSTPLSNTELYIGKTLAAMIPPLVASYGGMIVYMLSLTLGELQWRPAPMLIVQIFVLTTVQALVMITGSVVVSSQATSTRAANLLASFIIIPMTLAIQGESFVMFIAPDANSDSGIFSLWMIILGMATVVVLFLRVGNAIFNREELLGRTIDEFNLRSTFRTIWRNTRAIDRDLTPAANLWQWYRYGVWRTLRNLGPALWIVIAMFVIAFIGGIYISYTPTYQFTVPDGLDITENTGRLSLVFDLSLQTRAAGFIFQNNLRVLLAAVLLGLFSFGALALVLTPAVFVISGYIFGTLQQSAVLPMSLFWAGILPHGWLEIPAALLATVAAFRLGAIVTKPPKGETVGAAWMYALGETVKIFAGLVIPMLVGASLLEAYVTPRILVMVLGL